MRKIARKFKQTDSEQSFIAIWNDDGDLDELEVQLAVKALASAVDLPGGLQAVIYGSPWVKLGDSRTFRAFLLRHPDRHVQEWISQLESIA